MARPAARRIRYLAPLAVLLAGGTGAVALLGDGEPAGGCEPDLAELTIAGCAPLVSDTAAETDPVPLWGAIDCLDPSATGARHERVSAAGDPHLMGDGRAQPDNDAGAPSFRRMSLQDTDEGQWDNGQRCELGANDYRPSGPEGEGAPRTILYEEGQRRVTFLSVRLPTGLFDLAQTDDNFQIPMQMKGTQPSDGSGGNPALALHAVDQDSDGDGEWVLHRDDPDPDLGTVPMWCAPAELGRWTRFAFDVRYSQDPDLGSVAVYADLDGDGNAATDVPDDGDCDDPDDPDSGLLDERSEPTPTPTLTIEAPDAGTSDDDPLEAGDSIPSHLRVGLYQSRHVACPGPPGPGPGEGKLCAVDIDNVQVFVLAP